MHWRWPLIFVTALPLAILGDDIFLLIIAFFSFYLVFAGWRFARNSVRKPHWVDWAAVTIMAVTGLAMWAYGAVIGTSRRFNVDSPCRVRIDSGGAQLGGRAIPPQLVRIGQPTNSASPDQHAGRHHSHDNRGSSRQLRFRTRLDNLDSADGTDYAAHRVVECEARPVKGTTSVIFHDPYAAIVWIVQLRDNL